LVSSSHERGIKPKLQENLGCKVGICGIFKPNGPLANVVEDLVKVMKALPGKIMLLQWEDQETSWLEIVVVVVRGGRRLHYTEDD
jgi:hypothetical protein